MTEPIEPNDTTEVEPTTTESATLAPTSSLPEDILPLEVVNKLATQDFYDYIIKLHIKGYPHADIAIYCDYNVERIDQICEDYEKSDPHVKAQMIESIQTDLIKGTDITENRLKNIDNLIVNGVHDILIIGGDSGTLTNPIEQTALNKRADTLVKLKGLIQTYRGEQMESVTPLDAKFEEIKDESQVSSSLAELLKD